ncbi:MAG TPA: ATP-binding protein [Methanobacteriaceae archaeon]|nr:ATP-binding protein [Methanobacteriaceae archaeon]
MQCYLTGIFAGFIALDENFNVLDYELFPKDKLLEKYVELQKGEIGPQEKLIIKRLAQQGHHIIIESNKLPSTYNDFVPDSNFQVVSETDGGRFLRSHLQDILEKVGFIEPSDDLRDLLQELSIKITEDKLRTASRADDLMLIQAINAIEEVEEAAVKLTERLREWYPLHFPELDQIKNHEKYTELVAQYGDRDSIITSGVLNGEIEFENSLGADITPEDAKMLQEFARSLHSLQLTKTSLNQYVDKRMGELAPNLRELAGASLGAKLISHVGSIKRLAMLPSSTVQIIGAEKALFRHLKTGERPPKHGLIFQHPEVRGAKWWIRGKVSRALAAKITLAVRKDFFSGEKDPTIVKDFQKHLDEIRKAHPFPKRITKSKKPHKKKKRDKKRFTKSELKDYY